MSQTNYLTKNVLVICLKLIKYITCSFLIIFLTGREVLGPEERVLLPGVDRTQTCHHQVCPVPGPQTVMAATSPGTTHGNRTRSPHQKEKEVSGSQLRPSE